MLGNLSDIAELKRSSKKELVCGCSKEVETSKTCIQNPEKMFWIDDATIGGTRDNHATSQFYFEIIYRDVKKKLIKIESSDA